MAREKLDPTLNMDMGKQIARLDAMMVELYASAGGGGSGDVTAAAAFATDNLLIRADGTGKGVQNSNVRVTDDGALVINQTAAPTYIIEHTYDNGAETAPGMMFTNTVANAGETLTLVIDASSSEASIAFNDTSADAASGILRICTKDFDTRLGMTKTGNVFIGGPKSGGVGNMQDPTSAEGALIIVNGVAPTASHPNSIALYAEDVSSSSELKVRDEAGNVTTLSPHNFSLIPEGPSEPMAWAYYSEKDGKKINVDMLKLARMVEELTGEKLVYEA